jgi:hypothetical protein
MPSEEYWEKPQVTTERRITLAGYRIADLIIAAAENARTYGPSSRGDGVMPRR